MEEALRLTTDYLKQRKQFGVTLNTFQTLTQRSADMYVSLELARSMNLYAAMSIAYGLMIATLVLPRRFTQILARTRMQPAGSPAPHPDRAATSRPRARE